MLTAAVMSALLLGGSPQSRAAVSSDPQTSSLPDIEVRARPTTDAVRDFVGRIAAPANRRGLARWRSEICPGVANLDPAAAQAIIDRITVTAADLDIKTGEPGCDPNIVIVFTEDAPGLAKAMIARDPRIFRQNVAGNERGAAALRDFQTGDQPIRWWSLSLPVDSDTGQRAVRVAGDAGRPIDNVTAELLGCNPEDCGAAGAPVIMSTGASRLSSQIVDALYKSIIIVDVARIGQVNTTQLGDYLALVSLAQIDDQAETGSFDTVLNLFSGGGRDGMTDWDRSYLWALYGSFSRRTSPVAWAAAVANAMTRDRSAEDRTAP